MPRARPGPEQEARALIDAQLEVAGWLVQNREEANLSAAQGVAVRELRLADAYGYADYLLFVDGKAVGVVEAKPVGHSLTSVELQATKYSAGRPPGLDPPSIRCLSSTSAPASRPPSLTFSIPIPGAGGSPACRTFTGQRHWWNGSAPNPGSTGPRRRRSPAAP